MLRMRWHRHSLRLLLHKTNAPLPLHIPEFETPGFHRRHNMLPLLYPHHPSSLLLQHQIQFQPLFSEHFLHVDPQACTQLVHQHMHCHLVLLQLLPHHDRLPSLPLQGCHRCHWVPFLMKRRSGWFCTVITQGSIMTSLY
jgi:hypothetical protein